MTVVGCDFSTKHIDLVKVPFDTGPRPEWTRVTLARGGAFTAACSVRAALGQRALLGGYFDDVAAFYLEDPMSRGLRVAKALGLIAGALIACVPARVTVIEQLQPGEWRNLVGLPGNATKDQVAEHAYKALAAAYGHWNQPGDECWCCWPQDGLDAFCLARAGLNLCEKGAAA